MVIGGQAVLLYGEPRLTRDIDVTLGADTSRLKDLLDVVNQLQLVILTEDAENFVKQTMVLPVLQEATGVRVDFIFSFTSYETRAIERAKEIIVLGTVVRFATPEDVIIHKIFSHRPRDMEDVKAILLKNPGLDKQYICMWLKEFDKASDEKAFAEAFENILKEL